MLLLDERGSKPKDKLAPHLTAAGVPFEPATLECADIAVVSQNGVLGVERKRLGDLLRVIADNRFTAEQQPCLAGNFNGTYLLVEGLYRRSESGLLLRPRGREWEPVTWGRRNGWTFAEVEGWLMSRRAEGIQVVHTASPKQSVEWLQVVNSWWGKSDHSSGKGVFIKPLTTGFAPPSDTRLLASLLPGVGQERSAAVAAAFSNPWALMYAAAHAEPDPPGNAIAEAVAERARAKWLAIPGIGEGTLNRIVDWVLGRK